MIATIRKLSFGAILFAILAGLGLVAPSIAHADTSCYGDYCSGKDANATGCAKDAVTIASAAIYNSAVGITVGPFNAGNGSNEAGIVELRWSKKCGTKWAKINTSKTTGIISVVVTQDTGYEQRRNITGHWQSTAATVAYTNMVYSPERRCRAYVYGSGATEGGTIWA